MKMKTVSAEAAENDFVIGQSNFPDYKKALEKVKNLSKKEKLKISKQEDFESTWKELFEDSETEWYEAKLPPTTNFVNRIFDSGKGFMTHIGLRHQDLLKNYNTLPNIQRDIIDRIRKTLSPHPRVIVLTKDFKEFSIFDGGRRALAFMLEKKNIPCYIGKRKYFKALKYLR